MACFAIVIPVLASSTLKTGKSPPTCSAFSGDLAAGALAVQFGGCSQPLGKPEPSALAPEPQRCTVAVLAMGQTLTSVLFPGWSLAAADVFRE